MLKTIYIYLKLLFIISSILNLSIINATSGAYIDSTNLNKHPIKDSPYKNGKKIKLNFEKYVNEQKILKTHFTSNNAINKNLKKRDIGIYSHDIDNDGVNEILVMIINKDYCINNNCPFYIFKNLTTEGLKSNLLFGHFSKNRHLKMKILSSSVANYQDLLVISDHKFQVWKWDGKSHYKFSGLTD